MTATREFTCNRVGTTGHEILADGIVVGWAVDAPWAALIVALLNQVEAEGLSSLATPTGASPTRRCPRLTNALPGLRSVAADEPIRGHSG